MLLDGRLHEGTVMAGELSMKELVQRRNTEVTGRSRD